MHTSIVKHVVYPVRDLVDGLKGYNSMKYYGELMKSQWFTPAQLEDLQRKKLRVLLEHAYTNVPYYHKIFKNLDLKPGDINSIEDLSKLPVITKGDLIENFSDLIAKNIRKRDLITITTSGTTGEPFIMYRDRNEVGKRRATRFRVHTTIGFETGDNLVSLRVYPFSVRFWLNGLFLKTIRNEWIPHDYYLRVENLERFFNQLIRYKPQFIRGFPSTIYHLAKYMKSNDIGIKLKGILTNGETIYDYQRKVIQNQFDCKVFDMFGFRETCVYSYECTEHTGYHTAIENGIIELVKEGEHVSSGDLGATLFTDFNNFAMPLIRYVSGDLAVYSGEKCACGRGLPLIIKSLEGRFNDGIVSKDGRFIPCRPLVQIFGDIKIKEFQIIQKTNDKILVKIVTGPGYSSDDTTFIKKSIQKLTGQDINIEVEFADFIPRTAGGKKRDFILEIPTKFV
jgi:phenylacetate-CoA ligase